MTDNKKKNGFTLLEMTLAIGIFSVLVVSAIGIMLGVTKAQIKAGNIQEIQDNIRFGLELMTKELRTGNQYIITNFCGNSGEVNFLTAQGENRSYWLDTEKRAIMRGTNVDGSEDCVNASQLTADEILVENLIFQIAGQVAGPNDGQPRVTITLKVNAKDPAIGTETSMDLQTTVVQRLRDL